MRHRALILALAACTGGGQSPDPDSIVRTTGEFCLEAAASRGPSDAQDYQAGQPVLVRYTAADCLSSSCTAEAMAACAITSVAGELVVEAEASWTDLSGGMQGCTDDCQRVEATCLTEPLPSGIHAFTFGPSGIDLEIPSTQPSAICLTTGLGRHLPE